MTYTSLVLDMDGTLLNSNHEINDLTFKKLLDFQEAGNRLILASGRPVFAMMDIAKQLKMDHYQSYLISYNGALISQVHPYEEIFSQSLNLDDQKEIIPYIQARGLTLLTYDGSRIILDYENPHSHIEAEALGCEEDYNPQFFETLDHPVLKFIAVGDPDRIKEVDQEIGGSFGRETTVIQSQPYFLEIFNQKVSKGLAIEALGNRLGFGLDQVVAAGDGNNDLSMIEAAGLGVAMGNGSQAIKAAAQVITDTNDLDGLVPIIDQYFLNV